MSKIGFYDSRPWRRIRRQVMAYDNYECQYCKQRHRHTRGQLVHHIYHLDEYPQFGLQMWVDDPVTGARQRNLVTVCRICHETVCHPDRARQTEIMDPLTPERW